MSSRQKRRRKILRPIAIHVSALSGARARATVAAMQMMRSEPLYASNSQIIYNSHTQKGQ